MDRLFKSLRISARSCLGLALLVAVTLTAAIPADACLLAKRLAVVALHLTEAEVELYAHGNMDPLKVHYKLAAATTCTGGQADIFTCDGVDLLGHLNLSEIGGGNGNALWGWTDPVTGAEIALVGRTNGTAFVDVSDPVNPVYLGNLPSTAAALRGATSRPSPATPSSSRTASRTASRSSTSPDCAASPTPPGHLQRHRPLR